MSGSVTWGSAPKAARELFTEAVGYPLSDATEADGWTAADVAGLLREKAVEADDELEKLEACRDGGGRVVGDLDPADVSDVMSGHWSATSDDRESVFKAIDRGKRVQAAYDDAVEAWSELAGQ